MAPETRCGATHSHPYYSQRSYDETPKQGPSRTESKYKSTIYKIITSGYLEGAYARGGANKKELQNTLQHTTLLSVSIMFWRGTQIPTLPVSGCRRTITIMIRRQPYILIITWSRIDGKLRSGPSRYGWKLVAVCRAHTESFAKVHVRLAIPPITICVRCRFPAHVVEEEVE